MSNYNKSINLNDIYNRLDVSQKDISQKDILVGGANNYQNYTGQTQKRNQYVNLKINGRLFPSWIMANFKRYKLPEIFLDGSDPCNNAYTGNELRKYQQFLGDYLNYNSPYRDILIYHGLGSGKTRSAINIYNMLYNYSPDWNVFILLKATLKESTWVKELDSWLQKEEKEFRLSNIEFISYDAPNADKIFLEKVKNADSAKKSFYIIEESHNFINNVYTNINSKQGRRALTIYEHIIQDKKDNDGVRVILLSGSPAINNPYELALMFNLLRPDLFPKSESQFNQLYISTDAYPVINPATKNEFQRRIMGLVSYYIGSTPDYFARKTVTYVDVPMSDYQNEIYTHYEEIEEKIARKSKDKSSGNYKSYTRQSCNFVFPMMGQGLSGETRPRPRDFKIKESEVELYTKGVKNEKEKQRYFIIDEYIEKVNEFANEYDLYLQKKLDEDIKANYTLVDDLKRINEVNGLNIDTFTKFMLNDKEKKSNLLNSMHQSSAKMTFCIINIMNSPGPALVYSNYVVMEGLQIFKIYLKYFGFTSYTERSKGKDGFRYAEYHGGIDKEERSIVLDKFNKAENKYGDVAKIIMISPAGSEGISLNSVRQVHIMEPYWHEVRIMQMIGRAIRLCSHRLLPLEEREVSVFRYKSVRKDELDKWTTDQYIEDTARLKQGLIQSFLDSIKEAAVDCSLNKAHNSLVDSYRCFQFEEKSLFEDQIGPAYKDEIFDDLKFNNGSNSLNSTIKRIKVIKIKAVIQLKSDEVVEAATESTQEIKDVYSEPQPYWYNQDSHVVYDLDMQYPIGKVGTDEDSIPLKLNNDVFIINKLVPIPLIAQ